MHATVRINENIILLDVLKEQRLRYKRPVKIVVIEIKSILIIKKVSISLKSFNKTYTASERKLIPFNRKVKSITGSTTGSNILIFNFAGDIFLKNNPKQKQHIIIKTPPINNVT